MTPLQTSGLLAALACLAAPVPAQVQFTENAVARGLVHQTTTGLDRVGLLPHMLDWVQTGTAMGDLNGDGLTDVVVCGRFDGTSLFTNTGGAFVDSTARSGIAGTSLDNCVTLGDIDNDGDLDVFIGVHGPHEGAITTHDRLLKNDGKGHFTEVPGMIDTTGGGHTVFAKFFDVDYDGDLDLYSCQFNGTPNQLFINTGDGTFVERGAQLGADVGGSTHVASIADIDGDGFVDILLGDDFMVTAAAGMQSVTGDIFLRGVGDGSFVDVTLGSGFDLTGMMGATTMGMTLGDVNYDGLLDVYRSEFGDQVLSINHGWPNGGAFTEEHAAYGVDSPLVPDLSIPGAFGPTVGWGTKLMNIDHDLWLDLFEVTGNISVSSPRQQRSFAFLGEGPAAQFHFKDETQALGLYEQVDDRGLAVGDLDQDGDLDMLVMPAAGALRYLESNASTTPGGWLEVIAETQTSAPGGAGTRVSFTDSMGYPHVVSIGADGSTASHNEAMAHFGLGAEPAVDVTVAFPSGMTKTLVGTTPNQRIVVSEPEMIRPSKTRLRSAQTGYPEALTVYVAAFDAAGTPLTSSANVTIDITGLTPTIPTRLLVGNYFYRSFAPSAVAGEFRVHVTFNGWALAIRPTVTYVGPISPSVSGQVLGTDCVRAGSGDSFIARVTPRDAAGVVIGPGLPVFTAIFGAGGLPITPLIDMGDGSYEVLLPAPAMSGALPVSFAVIVAGQVTLLDPLTILESALAPSATKTEYYEEIPNVNFAASPNQLKLRVTPRDAAGARVGSQGLGSLTLAPSVGSVTVLERTELRRAHADGSFDFGLERAPGTPPFSGAGTLTFSLDGAAVISKPYSF